jgi:hypothetical protein
MSEQSTQNLRTDLSEHAKYNLLSQSISANAADQLLLKGSTEALPSFIGKEDSRLQVKSKKGKVRSARVIGTTAHNGELLPTHVDLSYAGMFARGLARLRGREANVQANITQNKTPLTEEDLKNPDNQYKPLYDEGEQNE